MPVKGDLWYTQVMPAYRTHVRFNLLIALPVSLLVLAHFQGGSAERLIPFAGTFVYGTLFLHPDLDLARQVKLFSIKGLLTLPFRPYSYLFSHRGISHWPVIGTLSRIGWAYGFLWLAGMAFPSLSSAEIAFLLGGFAAADLFHIALDRVG